MRNDHTVRPTRKVMIERFEWFAAANSPGSIEFAQSLFCLGINGEIGISRSVVFVDQLSDPDELVIPVGRRTAGNHLADLPQPQLLIVHPLPNRFVANRCFHRGKRFGNGSRRKIGEHNRFVVGIAGGSRLELRFQISLDFGVGRNLFFRPAPGRLTWPAAGSFVKSSRSARPRSMVLREQLSSSATYFTPPNPSCLASRAANRRWSFSDNVAKKSCMFRSVAGSNRLSNTNAIRGLPSRNAEIVPLRSSTRNARNMRH
jgi:hypothetical protein